MPYVSLSSVYFSFFVGGCSLSGIFHLVVCLLSVCPCAEEMCSIIWFCGVCLPYSRSSGSPMLFFVYCLGFCCYICIYLFLVAHRHGRFFYLLCLGFRCSIRGWFISTVVYFVSEEFFFNSEAFVASAHIALRFFASPNPVRNTAVFGVFPMDCNPGFCIKRVLHVWEI